MRLRLVLSIAALMLLSCSGPDGPTQPPPAPPVIPPVVPPEVPLPIVTIALAASDTMFELGQRDTVALTATLARTNYTEPVRLTATALPAGMSVVFTPDTLFPGVTSTSVRIVAGTFADTGVHIVRLVASGAGSVSTELPLSVRVAQTGGLTVTVPAGGLGFDQDDGVEIPVTLGRHGSFLGEIALRTGYLPEGMTATFLPSAVSGSSSVLALTASPSTPVGVHELKILGSATGWPSDSVLIPVTVGPQGAITQINVNFCFGSVVWVGYANRNGPWHEAASAGGSMHTVSLSQPTGSIAWVNDGHSHVYRGSIAELQQMAAWRNAICAGGAPVNERGLSGIAAGVAAGQRADLAMRGATGGSSSRLIGPDSVIGFPGLPNAGPLMLSAVRTGPNLADGRIVVRRGIDLPDQSSMPRLDFDGPESEPLVNATMTFTNANPSAVLAASVYVFSASTYSNFAAPPSFTYQGAPASLLEGGETNSAFVIEQRGAIDRFLALRFTNVVDRAFAFGPVLAQPEIRTLVKGTPLVVELRLPVQAEYADSVKSGHLTMSVTVLSGYLLGSDRWELSIPRMWTSPTYNPAWMPPSVPGFGFRIEAFGTGAPVNGATVNRQSSLNTYYYVP